MTKVRLNYDGWLSLPTAVRQKLGLTTGDPGLFGSGHERFVRAGRAAEGPAGCRSC
jgi:hypothetical protein